MALTMTRICSRIAFLAVIVALARAQSAAPTNSEPAPASEAGAPSPASRTVTLKQGTEVHLKLGQRLSAKTSMVNSPVELVLDEDLKVEDIVVANKGARVIGRVSEGMKDCTNGPCGWRDKRTPGKQLGIRLEYAVTPYGKVQLLGEEHGKARHDKGTVIASTAALGLTGFLIAWNAATKTVLEENTPVVATVASDFDLHLPPPSH